MEEKRGTILQSALKYMMHENTFTLGMSVHFLSYVFSELPRYDAV